MSEKVWQAPVVHFDSLNSVDNASKQNETTDFASMKPQRNFRFIAMPMCKILLCFK